MTVIYPQTLVDTRLTDVANAIDAGGAAGACSLYSNANVLLSTLPLNFPCGTVASGVLTFGGMPLVDPSAVATGNPTSATIQDSNGNNIITGLTVGTGSSNFDIVMTGATITAGQVVAISVATLTGR